MAKKVDELKEVKEELTNYMKEQIDFEVNKAVESNTKKLIRHKNIVIIKRDIIILVLLGLYAFLIYNLYTTNYFDKYLNKENTPIIKEESVVKEEESESEKQIDLKEEYSYLLDSFSISENSKYIEDYYRGKLSDELRLYISLYNVLNNEDLEDEFIDGSVIKETYESIFKGNVTNKSFEYNEAKIKYLNAKDIYIIDGELDNGTNIKREITNVYEKDDVVFIETVEGLIKDNKLYNIVTKKEVKKYDNKDLVKYQNDLISLRYKFDKKDLKILAVEVIN